eukprot:Seg907.1 transcript_id=Seg907.1/GoldUCD/mRNA.D3Y31 product="hypothetical protein" protein_id=Seg907.1/GoldUCD/D3Y31
MCLTEDQTDCSKCCIESDIESVETQTEPDQTNQHEIFQDPNVRLQNDHEEFKRFIHSEILAIKAQVANRSCSSPRESFSGGSPRENHLHEALIRSLQERIEKQLNDKQRIIEKILVGPSHHSPKHCENNLSNKATTPPMGIRQSSDYRNTTVEHNSYHNNSLEGLPTSNKVKTKENGNRQPKIKCLETRRKAR